MINKEEIWKKVLENIKSSVSLSNYKIFFENTILSEIDEGSSFFTAIVNTNNAFSQQNLEKKYLGEIKNRLTELLKKECKVIVEIGPVSKESKSELSFKDDSPPLFNQKTTEIVEKQNKNRLFKIALNKSGLKKENTFENFAVSPTNEVAYAAALAVAKEPGKAYNPLFLYGDVGVGKTHLMQSIGNRILQGDPEKRIVYCMGEQFTNEIIEAIRMKKTPQFRAKYREANALLIDDIQFIAGKNTVQEEFFHTFNAITSVGGQVVLTSDRPPHEIRLLEDRLRSRFEEGLTIDIQAPNFELRTAILLIKSKQMGKELSMEVAQTIANHITSTRGLQGMLSKLYAMSTFTNKEITEDFAFSLIRNQNMAEEVPSQKKYINPKTVVDVIARRYNVSPKLLYGPKRDRPIVVPRQYAMYLLKTDLKISLVEIGRFFGGRDHTTVMHAIEKVSKMVASSPELQNEFSTLKKEIYG